VGGVFLFFPKSRLLWRLLSETEWTIDLLPPFFEVVHRLEASFSLLGALLWKDRAFYLGVVVLLLAANRDDVFGPSSHCDGGPYFLTSTRDAIVFDGRV